MGVRPISDYAAGGRMLGATLPPQSGKAIAARRELLGERRKVAVALGELVTDLLGALDPDNRERGNADCDQRDNERCGVVHLIGDHGLGDQRDDEKNAIQSSSRGAEQAVHVEMFQALPQSTNMLIA
jgi:hypothetical protein